jgi:RNA recognition motif-containing protein
MSSSSHKLFIGGVGYRTTAETFKEFFSKFGEIADAVTMHTSDGKSRGFGFVTFENKSDAEKVLASAPEDLELDGRRLEPKWAIPKASEVAAATKREADDYATGNFKSKKIFVGGISAETTDEDLKEYFGTFGTITETVIMMDRDSNRSRGFGFVTFDNEDVVDTVCREKHDLGGRSVECKKAVPKEVQQSGRYRPPNNRLDRQERERGDRRGSYGGRGGGRRDLSPRGRAYNGYDDYSRPYDRYDDYDRGRRDPYDRDYYYGGRDPYERDYYRDYYDRDGRDDRGYYRQGPPPGDYRPRAAYGDRDPYYNRGGDYADPRAPAPPPSQSRYDTSARPAYSASSAYPQRDASQPASQASSRPAYSAPGSSAPAATSQYATQSYTSTYSKSPYTSAPQSSSTPASTAPYSRPQSATATPYSSAAYSSSTAYQPARQPSYTTPASSSYSTYPSSSSNAPGSAPSNQYSSYAATTPSTANTSANRTNRAYRPY